MNPSRLRLPLLSLLLAMSGCATRLPQPVSGYTCCNLRPSYGWIYSENLLGGAIIPAGEPVQLDKVKRDIFFYGTIGGEYIASGDNAERSVEGTQRWLRQLMAPKDPRLALAVWSTEVQNAVRSAKVMVGMSREQVLMSLSYSSRDETPDLHAGVWRY